MADIAITSTTVIHQNVAGNERIVIGQYAATTAAGSDTVATPLSVVNFVSVEFASTVALTTATIVSAQPSTLAGAITVQTSTHDNLSVRYRITGR